MNQSFRIINEKIESHIRNKSKVISLEHGVGEITSNFTMYDGIDDYLEVFYIVDGKSRYFCIKHISDIRLLSTKSTVQNALHLLNERLNDHSIANVFCESKTKFFDKDVLFIVKRIVDLIRRVELNELENSLLRNSIESLVSEVEEVFSVEQSCARGIVSDYLKCA